MNRQNSIRSTTSPCARRVTSAAPCAAALLAGIVLATALGCSTTPMLPPPLGTPPIYRVGAPDVLSITILPEPIMAVDVNVRPDGMISVPLIGEVSARDRTIPEISADIEQRMLRFKRGAQVSVALVTAASTDITIIGEVARIAAFPLVKETRIVEAIGQVGGVTHFASQGKIRVIRTENGQMVVHRVDLKAIRKGDLSTNMLLEPDDIVYVPPTFMARIGYVMQQLLFPFQPVLGMARVAAGNLLTP